MTAYHNIGENVQVIENEDGEAEIIHKESGESARIGPDGFVTPSVSTDEQQTTKSIEMGDGDGWIIPNENGGVDIVASLDGGE